jgi:hypothetical protein
MDKYNLQSLCKALCHLLDYCEPSMDTEDKPLVEETVETENPLFAANEECITVYKGFAYELANNGQSVHYFNEANKESIRKRCQDCKTFDDYYKKFDEIDRLTTAEYIEQNEENEVFNEQLKKRLDLLEEQLNNRLNKYSLDLDELRTRLEEETKNNELKNVINETKMMTLSRISKVDSLNFQ